MTVFETKSGRCSELPPILYAGFCDMIVCVMGLYVGPGPRDSALSDGCMRRTPIVVFRELGISEFMLC